MSEVYKLSDEKVDPQKYIGKFFKRDTGNTDYCVCKITGFDENYFLVTEYYLTLGYSTKEVNQRKMHQFVIMSNFKEISKVEFETVEHLCVRPYVTIYDENGEAHLQ